MYRAGTFAFLFSLWVVHVHGQQGSLLFNTLAVKDGLSDPANLYDVYQDRRGFIWIGSLNGLNRFDGTTVLRYFPDAGDSCAIVGENIQSTFFELDSSALWFTTTEAINRYDWKTDCFHAYYITDDVDSLDGYQAIFLDANHNLWILGTRLLHAYLYTFNLDSLSIRLVTTLSELSQRAIAVPDSLGNVRSVWTYWINEMGVEKLDLDIRSNVLSREILFDSVSQYPLKIQQLIRQGDSLLWALSIHSLLKFNIQTTSSHYIPVHQGEAVSLQLMNDSTLLIGLLKNGLLEFNIPGEKFTYQYEHLPEERLSLLSNQVDHISMDHSGNVWVGSRGFGLSYGHPLKQKFKTFYPHIEQPDVGEFYPTTFLRENNDAICCATRSNGLFIIHRSGPDGQEIKPFPGLEAKALLGPVHDVFKDQQNRYWLVTFPGLSVFDESTHTLLHVSKESQFAISGMPWSNNKMMFSGKGLFEFDGDMNSGFKLNRKTAISDTVQYLPIWLDKKGRLWMSEYNGKYYILDTADFHTEKILPIWGFTTHIVESPDGSTVWVNTSKNLYEIDSDSLSIRKILDKKVGFPDGAFSSMIMDFSGRLWLTSSGRLLRYDPRNDSLRIYAQEDGLPQLSFTKAAFRFDDGEIWLGSPQSITRFYPERIRDLQIEAIPQITEIFVNDHVPEQKLVCDKTGSINTPQIQELTFSYKNNTLAFRLNALEFSSPRHNNIRYQMEGLDNQPIITFSGNLVRYPNLQAKTYRFVVYASNSDGVYNPKPHVLILHINPPYYKTWWFYVLVVLTSISIIAYIIYLRFTKTLELQRVRLKLYENLHDDVGSRLTAIVLSAEDLERNEKINNPKIQSISKIAKSIVENMRRLVWAIDPENDKVSTIVQKITHDKSLILGDHISFSIHVDDHLKNVIIPGEIRYQISSICNEAFNNISKYAEATAVAVNLTRNNRKFHLVITDNGKGFDPEATSKNNVTGSGYGLNNMKRRASRVKGNLEIFSKPGEGTRIVADFPY